MKITNKLIVKQCMERIELMQRHIQHIDGAARFLGKEISHVPVNMGNLREQMVSLELAEWRKMAMWGLTVEDAYQDRIKAAVHDRFLSDDMCVAKWLSGTGEPPSRWLSSDEEDFRKMAKKAFAPK